MRGVTCCGEPPTALGWSALGTDVGFKISKQSPNFDLLTQGERETAWRLAYCFSLDGHPSCEIAWESDTWRRLGAPALAEIGDQLLAERRADDFDLPEGVQPDQLTRLLSRVSPWSVSWWIKHEGLCLLAAMRLVYWCGFARVPR